MPRPISNPGVADLVCGPLVCSADGLTLHFGTAFPTAGNPGLFLTDREHRVILDSLVRFEHERLARVGAQGPGSP